MKHTPGPWKVEERAINEFYIVDLKVKQIALIFPWDSTLTKEETEANATLIAHAPDMLELIRTARDLLRETSILMENTEHGNLCGLHADDIEALINKIEGKEA